jgi:hypothetical protein
MLKGGLKVNTVGEMEGGGRVEMLRFEKFPKLLLEFITSIILLES